jgi:uncharacterized protein YjbI with pentapeptide repeats
LYSTASYQTHNLAGIGLGYNNLAGVNLSGQNLSGASFGGAVLTGANFNHANLIRGYLSGANVVGADFTAADLRGVAADNLDLTQAITNNMIGPDGRVVGLQLGSGQSLTIRNMVEEVIGPPGGLGSPSYVTIIIPAFPVTIDQHFNMSSGGTLQLLFDSNPWTAVISFQSGIPVELGGTLDLEFADGADPSSQIGKPIHVFDWTGVTSNGTFDIGGPYTWDISQLYTSGDVTLTAVPEPASLLLLLIGGLATTWCIRTSECRLRYSS